MPFLIPLVLFCIATFVLVKGADAFIENADKIGKSLHWPGFLTGVLIVAIGTSLPELATGIASLLNDEGGSSLLVGNVLGSNVANVFLGLGLVVVIARKNLQFKQNIFHVHFPVLMITTVAFIAMAMDREVTKAESCILLGVLGSYLWFLFSTYSAKSTIKEKMHHEAFKWRYVFLLIIGLLAVIGGSHFVIDSVLQLGALLIEVFNVSEDIWTALAATLVAVGTSLPEMVVVYGALKKDNAEMAVGNILGSNIFNILLIVGVGGLIAPLAVDGINFTILLPFSVASFFVYWTISKDQEITQQESLAMVFLYILFIGKLYRWL